MNKLLDGVKNPRKVLYFLSKYYDRYFKSKLYISGKEFSSDSENGAYVSTVLNILKNKKAFKNFKRKHSYQHVLEHVSEHQGKSYLEVLKSRNDVILKHAIETVLVTDSIGNPIKFKYHGYSIPLSPTTLRYVKVSSDLKILFGQDLGDVAEIGCGYGGQTLVNDQLLKVRTAKLFDLSVVNKLINLYLDTQLLHSSYKTTVINQELPSNYDIVISNYAFSELPKKLQIKYIDKVLSHSRKGYLTMNSGLLSEKRSIGKLSLEELRHLLPDFEIFEEEPLTYQNNYIIVWGHNKDKARDYFTVKN
jgi:hypothetical protein